MSKLEVGNKVTVTKKADCYRDGDRRYYAETGCKPKSCIFLGFTCIHSGTVKSGTLDEPKYLQVEESHRVAVVQPIHGANYRKPFYAVIEECT